MEGGRSVLVALHFCQKDREQAQALAEWILETGPVGHDLLLARDRRAAEIPTFSKAFRSVTEMIITDDTANKWCESANHAFKKIAKHIQYSMGAVPFLFLEPDCVILRGSAFDEIEAEYNAALKSGKQFLGDLQDAKNNAVAKLPGFVNHMSGIGVYPGNLTEFAGEVFYAGDTAPWDIVAGHQIYAQAMQSELILQSWNQNGQGVAPFTSWQDFEQKVLSRRPKCALFHADKSGSLIQLLREHGKEGDATCQEHALVKPTVTEAEEQTRVASTTELTPSLPVSCSSAEPTSEPESTAWSEPKGSEPASDFINLPGPDAPRYKIIDGEYKRVPPWRPLESWHDQTPWESQDSSLTEIRQMAERLKQFCTNNARTRTVRIVLNNHGVIQLSYRHRKRGKWKRKKKRVPYDGDVTP